MSDIGIISFQLFPFAMTTGKALSIGVVGLILLLSLFFLLHSMGLTKQTSPKMLMRKLVLWFRSLTIGSSIQKKIQQGEVLLGQAKWDEALAFFSKNYVFDGMIGGSNQISVLNEAILHQLESMARHVQFPFPAEQHSRLLADIHDYLLLKKRHFNPEDYDDSPLQHAQNEQRFLGQISHQQESRLIQGYRSFFQGIVEKLRQHIQKNGPFPPYVQNEVTASQEFMEAYSAPVPSHSGESKPPSAESFPSQDPFAAGADPFGASEPASLQERLQENEIRKERGDVFTNPVHLTENDPFAGGGVTRADGDAESSNLSSDGSTALVDANDLLSQMGALKEKEQAAEQEESHPPYPPSKPTGGFSGIEAPSQSPFAGQPASGSLPSGNHGFGESPVAKSGEAHQQMKSTGGFQGFGSQPSQQGNQPLHPTGGFPGFGSQQGSTSGSFSGLQQPPPQGNQPLHPTGGFPGFGSQPPQQGNQPSQGNQQPSRPTGGFPGFGSSPSQPGNQQSPRPTGGFPGFGSQPPPQGSTPPRPTGGFPGFGSQPSQGNQQPQGNQQSPRPTGGFPGFGSQPPPQGSTPPRPTGGFPGFGGQQPTGGFPGFGNQRPQEGNQQPPRPTGGFPGFGGQPPQQKPTGGFPSGQHSNEPGKKE